MRPLMAKKVILVRVISVVVVERMGTGRKSEETLPMAPVARHHVGLVDLRSTGGRIALRQINKLAGGHS